MLFLFKIYGSEDGIVNCCQTNKNLKHLRLDMKEKMKDLKVQKNKKLKEMQSIRKEKHSEKQMKKLN